MSRAFGFARGVLCPKCGKWARLSTTLSFGKGKKAGGIVTIKCKYCGFVKIGKSLKELD